MSKYKREMHEAGSKRKIEENLCVNERENRGEGEKLDVRGRSKKQFYYI